MKLLRPVFWSACLFMLASALGGLAERKITLASGSDANMDLSTAPLLFQTSGKQDPAPKERSRMDDRGCCVLKKSQYKKEWVFNDGEIRRQCIRDARALPVDYDFYRDKKCEDVKKEINDGTAIPN